MHLVPSVLLRRTCGVSNAWRIPVSTSLGVRYHDADTVSWRFPDAPPEDKLLLGRLRRARAADGILQSARSAQSSTCTSVQ